MLKKNIKYSFIKKGCCMNKQFFIIFFLIFMIPVNASEQTTNIAHYATLVPEKQSCFIDKYDAHSQINTEATQSTLKHRYKNNRSNHTKREISFPKQKRSYASVALAATLTERKLSKKEIPVITISETTKTSCGLSKPFSELQSTFQSNNEEDEDILEWQKNITQVTLQRAQELSKITNPSFEEKEAIKHASLLVETQKLTINNRESTSSADSSLEQPSFEVLSKNDASIEVQETTQQSETFEPVSNVNQASINAQSWTSWFTFGLFGK